MLRIPQFDTYIESEFERSESMIEELSSSRQYNSYSSLKGWRKLVKGIDINQTGQKYFIGEFVDRNEEIELNKGAVLIQYDSLYINAKFKASTRSYAPTSMIHVELYQVTDEGLTSMYNETSRKFKTWHKRLGREFNKLTGVAWPATA